MKVAGNKNSKFIIVHLKHIFMVNILDAMGALGCHVVINSTGSENQRCQFFSQQQAVSPK